MASYQAASGAGQAGIDRLHAELAARGRARTSGVRGGDVAEALAAGLPAESPFPAPLALNVVPWAGSLKDDGWSSEELKVRNESRKILGIPDLQGVGDLRAGAGGHHALAGRARDVRARGVRRGRAQGAGRAAVDRAARRPGGRRVARRPADVVGDDPTWVGRIRQALDFPNTLELFVCGDNLRKGAALNTYEIAETVAAG